SAPNSYQTPSTSRSCQKGAMCTGGSRTGKASTPSAFPSPKASLQDLRRTPRRARKMPENATESQHATPPGASPRGPRHATSGEGETASNTRTARAPRGRRAVIAGGALPRYGLTSTSTSSQVSQLLARRDGLRRIHHLHLDLLAGQPARELGADAVGGGLLRVDDDASGKAALHPDRPVGEPAGENRLRRIVSMMEGVAQRRGRVLEPDGGAGPLCVEGAIAVRAVRVVRLRGRRHRSVAELEGAVREENDLEVQVVLVRVRGP